RLAQRTLRAESLFTNVIAAVKNYLPRVLCPTRRGSMDTVKKLLDLAGRTYADAAGITLQDTHKPLFQLLVLALLSSTRISADIAVAAARELFHAGWRTPKAMAEAPRAEVIAAL